MPYHLNLVECEINFRIELFYYYFENGALLNGLLSSLLNIIILTYTRSYHEPCNYCFSVGIHYQTLIVEYQKKYTALINTSSVCSIFIELASVWLIIYWKMIFRKTSITGTNMDQSRAENGLRLVVLSKTYSFDRSTPQIVHVYKYEYNWTLCIWWYAFN